MHGFQGDPVPHTHTQSGVALNPTPNSDKKLEQLERKENHKLREQQEETSRLGREQITADTVFVKPLKGS